MVPIKTHEDRESHQEAKDLLRKDFGIKDAPEYVEHSPTASEPTVAAPVAAAPVDPPAPPRRAPHPKMGGGWCPAGYSSSDPAQKAAAKLKKQAEVSTGATKAENQAQNNEGATAASSSSPAQSRVSKSTVIAGGVAAGVVLSAAAAYIARRK